MIKSLKTCNDSEVSWLRRLVAEHPAFPGVPEEVKSQLIEAPAENVIPLGNRRQRRLWKSRACWFICFPVTTLATLLAEHFMSWGKIDV